jgi:hypothetical protein
MTGQYLQAPVQKNPGLPCAQLLRFTQHFSRMARGSVGWPSQAVVLQ